MRRQRGSGLLVFWLSALQTEEEEEEEEHRVEAKDELFHICGCETSGQSGRLQEKHRYGSQIDEKGERRN